MTTTSTQGIWVTDPEAYRRKLDELVGRRDPLAVLAETADVLEMIVRETPAAVLRARPLEGRWTPLEVIGHLVDAEWVYGYRMRAILSEESPPILGMDQDRWVAAQRYNDQDPAAVVDMFRSMRSYNLSLWRSMSAEDLERAGRHNERGPESLGQMRGMLAGHDLWHIDQIRRYVRAVEDGRAA